VNVQRSSVIAVENLITGLAFADFHWAIIWSSQ